jgi:hypothetical protein
VPRGLAAEGEVPARDRADDQAEQARAERREDRDEAGRRLGVVGIAERELRCRRPSRSVTRICEYIVTMSRSTSREGTCRALESSSSRECDGATSRISRSMRRWSSSVSVR